MAHILWYMTNVFIQTYLVTSNIIETINVSFHWTQLRWRWTVNHSIKFMSITHYKHAQNVFFLKGLHLRCGYLLKMIAKVFTDVLFQDVLSKCKDGWTILLERIYETSLKCEWMKAGEGIWREAGGKKHSNYLHQQNSGSARKDLTPGKGQCRLKKKKKTRGRELSTPVRSTAEKYPSIRLHPGTQERNLGIISDSLSDLLVSKSH